MKKEWFVFQGKHHIGPFSIKEIEKMVSLNEIQSNNLIWKEGEKDWVSLSDAPDFKFLSNPDLLEMPPLPKEIAKGMADSQKNKKLPYRKKPNIPELPESVLKEIPIIPIENKKIHTQVEEDLLDMPPPIPLDEIIKSHDEHKTRTKFIGVKKDSSSKVLFLTLFVAFLAVTIWYMRIAKESSVKLYVKGIMPFHLEALENTASSQSLGREFKLALSMNGKKIFLATNSSQEMSLNLTLHSIPKSILGQNSVQLKLRGKAANHLATFEKVTVLNDGIFAPGKYRVELTGVAIHPLLSYFPILNQFSFLRNFNETLDYQFEDLIYPGSQKEFEQNLIQYREKLMVELTRPLISRLEKITTLKSMIEKLNLQLESTLRVSKKSSELKSYQKFYTAEVLPVVDQILKSTPDTDKRDLEVLQLFGVVHSDLIFELSKVKKINAESVGKINELKINKYNQLNSKIDDLKKELEIELEKLKN